MFSEATRRQLQKAGWSEDYRVDTTKFVDYFQQEGYPILPEVIDFLSRFGRLRVVHPDIFGRPDRNEFHFDPLENSTNSEKLSDYSERAGTPLCIIGEKDRGHMQLMMGADGKVYAAFDETLVLVGNSEMEAIEAMCNSRPCIHKLS